MKRATLVLLFNSKKQILLWMKKRWFWMGKWNGFGGKPNWEESTDQTASRELYEESGIVLPFELLQSHWLLHFFFEWNSDRDQDVYVFSAKYDGDFKETDEMLPKRRDLDKIPYDQMREDDKYRLPKLIAWESFDISFHFDKSGKLKS